MRWGELLVGVVVVVGGCVGGGEGAPMSPAPPTVRHTDLPLKLLVAEISELLSSPTTWTEWSATWLLSPSWLFFWLT